MRTVGAALAAMIMVLGLGTEAGAFREKRMPPRRSGGAAAQVQPLRVYAAPPSARYLAYRYGRSRYRTRYPGPVARGYPLPYRHRAPAYRYTRPPARYRTPPVYRPVRSGGSGVHRLAPRTIVVRRGPPHGHRPFVR